MTGHPAVQCQPGASDNHSSSKPMGELASSKQHAALLSTCCHRWLSAGRPHQVTTAPLQQGAELHADASTSSRNSPTL